MVEISPFKGMFYNQTKIPDLSKVLSPPYDIITPDLKSNISKFSPYNIVNLILPEKKNGKNKYEYAGSLLEKWIKDEILVFDREECFYLFEEEFKLENSIKKILGFIGLTKIEPYSAGKILRHENTLAKPKQDRFNLLKKTKANFGLIYTIYKDRSNLIQNIGSRKKKADIIISPLYDQNLKFRLWKVKEQQNIKQISELMDSKSILIADGHHRYETSKLYMETVNDSGESKNYILTLFVNSSQKDISIWPTYRLIKFKKFQKTQGYIDRFKKYFNIQLRENASDAQVISEMTRLKKKSQKVFCLYDRSGKAYFLTLKASSGHKNSWKNLDVNILHNLIIGKIIPKNDIQKISFSHSIGEVSQNIANNNFDLAILLNAPEIGEVEDLSAKGYLMPQKSTYFYPKPCTGLVMYKFYK
ncbi:MAG: DUF1015 domain-containing protein [Candidatus Humimicrobiaceae bacterium]